MSRDSRGAGASVEGLVLLLAMFAATVWYAFPQLAYSVYPVIELLRGIFR